MRNGAAKLIPMKSTPKYMQSPKADNVAIVALTFPKSPSHGFDLTQSAIMQVTERAAPVKWVWDSALPTYLSKTKPW